MTCRAEATHSASADHSMTAAELDDECPSVSLDSSIDELVSFDGDDCATTAQKVTDLVLPHILGVNPCNYQPLHV